MGYQPQLIKITAKTKSPLSIRLKESTAVMTEFVVSAPKKRYSRKNNPAVELMKHVVAAREQTKLENHDYYQYTKYQKISLALNDYRAGQTTGNSLHHDSLSSDSITQGLPTNALDTIITSPDSTALSQNSGWAVEVPTDSSHVKRRFDWGEHTEISPYNGKRIMPLMYNEVVTQHVFRKQPHAEKDIVHGEQASGLNQLLTTGEMANTVLKEVFQDINIYDDYVRLLQYPFVSPIGNHAVNFYRFFIQDTVEVAGQRCYHLEFAPNNVQDFGFSGELYILADSSLHVRKCRLSVPRKSDVNFVDNLQIEQEFVQLENGEWALATDLMWAELRIARVKALAVRDTRISNYAFDALPNALFRGRTEKRMVANARNRDDEFWNEYRAVALTAKEAGVGGFMEKLKNHKGFKVPLFIIKAVGENYIETGPKDKPSKFDFGPVMSSASYNFVDGFRLRLSGRTMAALHPRLFWHGYAAYGFKSRQPYYGSTITWSFNKKKLSPFEFPMRNIIFESAYDVMSPSDKFLINDKDNLLMGIRTQTVKQMYFYNRQRLSFVYETENGLNLKTSLKTESNEVTGDLHFKHLHDGGETRRLRTTEWSVGLHYAPGQTFVNTKQNRYPINFDNPEYYLRHTMGFDGFLGGQYRMNMTEAGIYKRQWLGSWGHIDLHIDVAAQWNKLPFPLLMTPPISLTYIQQEGTFSMLRNMEFFMDRKLCWMVAWDLNGKIFNRIPLLKKLKWREYVAFKGVWGQLTDKNNPTLRENAGDQELFQLPQGSYPIDPKRPYMEVSAGVHNIFNLFSVEWVHRINYHEHPDTKTDGVRFGFQFSF
ncbi:MAG: DUF5686 family protein [Bacteroidales bacterium]|nr:DUF5686 family protein [Bacteroidales bacterium]